MAQIPVIDLAQPDPMLAPALAYACANAGCFYVFNHGIPDAWFNGVLEQAALFFELPEAEKTAIHIRRSDHFRGYSQMKNVRDWREQMHFSFDLPKPALPADYSGHQRLVGPNLWPDSEVFRQTVSGYLDAAGKLGAKLLFLIGAALEGFDFGPVLTENPYHLLKLICYYPQPGADERAGVAAHCDWSLLTLLHQDDTGGLEVLLPGGEWVAAQPESGALFVNVGELLEIISGGRFAAAPHRVVNPSRQRRRISVPVFINPALDALIEAPGAGFSRPARVEREHVHRVQRPGAPFISFRFGDSEWRRKGLGKWCYEPDCLIKG